MLPLSLVVIVAIVIIYFFGYWQNNGIGITTYTYYNKKIPTSFNGYTIVQISDLHNAAFGSNQAKLLKKVKQAAPDIIVITGDLIDSRRTNLAIAMEFVQGAVQIATVYYITGNHESRIDSYPELREQLERIGVLLMDDKSINISNKEASIALIGLSDPAFRGNSNTESIRHLNLDEKLAFLTSKEQSLCRILLAHRPELITQYAEHPVDLVFSGHAHGGQFRIPFVCGLYAPSQGFFPKYTNGQHVLKETTMIISRGLGNSSFPFRLFNRPEIVVVHLQNNRRNK